MRAVIGHESAEGLRTWELIEAEDYFFDPMWGRCLFGRWASGLTRKHIALPLTFVQVVA